MVDTQHILETLNLVGGGQRLTLAQLERLDLHQHSNRPAQSDMYVIRYGAIAELPPGREKLILSRKAICAFAGLSSTPSLKTYGVFEESRAYGRLHGLALFGPGVAIPTGYEPSDSSDKSKNPVSLEQFCRDWEMKNASSLGR